MICLFGAKNVPPVKHFIRISPYFYRRITHEYILKILVTMKYFGLIIPLFFCSALQAAPLTQAEGDSTRNDRKGHPAWKLKKNMKLVNDTLIVDFANSKNSPLDIAPEKIAAAVEAIPDSEFAGIKGLSLDELKNRRWMVEEHNRVNHNPFAVYFNGNFMKSTVGLDGFFLRKAKREFTRDTVRYNGKLYQGKVELFSPHYKPDLTDLEAIHERYAPSKPLRSCLFMVDGILLTSGLNDFRFDTHYIDSVDVIDLSGVPLLESGDSIDGLSLIHIYTRKSRMKRGWTVSFEFPDKKSLVLKPYNQKDVNRAEKTFFLNGEEIGTFVGIDIQALLSAADRRVSVEENAVKINSSGYAPRLVSLKEIGEQFPGTSAIDPLFFVNDVLLTGDPAKIRIDVNYIQNICLFTSTELESLGGGVVNWGHHTCPVSVIRIYTNDEESQKKARQYAHIQ